MTKDGDAGVRTPDFLHAKQALYLWATSPLPNGTINGTVIYCILHHCYFVFGTEASRFFFTFTDQLSHVQEIGIRAAQNLVFLGITMWIAKKLLQWAVDAMDPTSKEKVDAQQRADKLLEQIGIQVRIISLDSLMLWVPPQIRMSMRNREQTSSWNNLTFKWEWCRWYDGSHFERESRCSAENRPAFRENML